jgi:hypothetical protein
MKTSQLRIEAEHVAQHDAQGQLDERHRDADLDRDHARDQSCAGKDRCELNWLHSETSTMVAGRS